MPNDVILSEQEANDMEFCFEHLKKLPEKDQIFVLECLMLAHEAKRARQRL